MNTNRGYTLYRDPKYCFVPACKNNSRDTQKIFFTVPHSTKQEWCIAVGTKCPKRDLNVCEDHLNLEEDVENYFYWRTMRGRAKLKPRLPQSLIRNPQEPSTSTSSESLQMQTDVNKVSIPIISHKKVQVKTKTSDQSKSKKPTLEDDEMLGSIFKDELPSARESTASADISEVSSEVTYGRTFMLNLIKKKPLIYIGLPKNYYWLIEYLEIKLKVKAFNTILTLYKIKNSIPFYQISDMFEISLSILWRIFFRTLHILSIFFKQLIFTPNVFHVKINLPTSFRNNKEYSNVFCIIDCLEIEIEKPSNPINQSLTWSQNKNANTIKYLLGVTPDGFVNFVSEGFGGSISDANIVEHSGILTALPPNCTILADRGFKQIGNVFDKKQIKLLRLPIVSKDSKLTKKEAIKSKVIASLRNHVERVIRRVQLYKCLKPHSVINEKIIQHADEIVMVACGLVNLQTSIAFS